MARIDRGLLCATVLLMGFLKCGEAQIPSECANSDSLPAGGGDRRCCPNATIDDVQMECGGPTRGVCERLNISETNIDHTYRDPRVAWPAYYFTHVCKCKENFGGVNCGSCAYGRYPNDTCENIMVLERKNLKKYKTSDWNKYLDILKNTRTYDSGYKAIVNGTMFDPELGFESIRNEIRNITLYDFFVWIHYLVAKDSEHKELRKRKDFAHEGTGFLTWHRQMLLWLEWKIQEMLRERDMDDDYHTFRLPFWDWTDKGERRKYFTEDRLGKSVYTEENNKVSSELTGTLFGDNGTDWLTICWKSKKGPGPDGDDCDPGERTDPLKRCPKRNSNKERSDPCNSDDYWPTTKDVWEAVDNHDKYDVKDSGSTMYNVCPAENSFRTFLEGFVPIDNCDKNSADKLCSPAKPQENIPCSRTRKLHNSVHIILGAGDIKGFDDIDANELGVMAHVAASPNDPIFINHHTMIDCVFDRWFEKENPGSYPTDATKDGHNIDDYIVPFIPLFKHSDMFKKGSNFGYKCGDLALSPVAIITLFTAMFTLIISVI